MTTENAKNRFSRLVIKHSSCFFCCAPQKNRAFLIYEKGPVKQSVLKTAHPDFYRAGVLSVRRASLPFRQHRRRAGLPAWASAPRLRLPVCTHSDVLKPELFPYGGGPAQVLHLFPYSPGRLTAAGHPAAFCLFTVTQFSLRRKRGETTRQKTSKAMAFLPSAQGVMRLCAAARPVRPTGRRCGFCGTGSASAGTVPGTHG